MKLSEAIIRAQKLKPDIYGDEIMSQWISELDGRLSVETMGQTEPVSYRWPADTNADLLVPTPYDNVYELYIVSMTDFHNREMEKYANDSILFDQAMGDFKAYYRRTHAPADAYTFSTV